MAQSWPWDTQVVKEKKSRNESSDENHFLKHDIAISSKLKEEVNGMMFN